MKSSGKNIYQTARQSAGLTQERAAELIGCTSVRSLAAYETGERTPDDDIVIRMVEVYGTQFLAYQHLRHNMDIAKEILPEIYPQPLTMAVLSLQKELRELLKMLGDIIQISHNGVIGEEEKDRWSECMKEAEDVQHAIMALKYAKMEE